MGTKTCPKCGVTKSLDEGFYRNRSARSGRQGHCKTCVLSHAKQRPRTPTDPVKNRGWFLARRYKLTTEAYEAQLVAQGGGCAICGGVALKRALPVDHDHRCCPGDRRAKCGECNRGLLCNKCNGVLGLIEDPVWLKATEEYLRKWGQTSTHLEVLP